MKLTVEIWCAECGRTFSTPEPPDLWSWLIQHRVYGLCFVELLAAATLRVQMRRESWPTDYRLAIDSPR